MLLIRQCVDDGDRREAGVFVHDALAVRAHGHDVDVAGEDAGDIADGFSLAEAHLARGQVHRERAEVVHCDLEADAGAQGRFLEQEREVLTFEQAPRRGLQAGGELQEVGGFGWRKIGGGKEVPGVRLHQRKYRRRRCIGGGGEGVRR